jgi:hypothetical protein
MARLAHRWARGDAGSADAERVDEVRAAETAIAPTVVGNFRAAGSMRRSAGIAHGRTRAPRFKAMQP